VNIEVSVRSVVSASGVVVPTVKSVSMYTLKIIYFMTYFYAPISTIVPGVL